MPPHLVTIFLCTLLPLANRLLFYPSAQERGKRMLNVSNVSNVSRLSNHSSTAFLDQLATELKIGRDSAYRHAVQRTLVTVKKNYESGLYQSTTEAQLMLRKLADKEAQSNVS